MFTIGASVICMNQGRLIEDVAALAGCIDRLHIDVMDGVYVPRYGMYPEQVAAISQHTSMPMDVHLMTVNPEFSAAAFYDFECVDYISFHYAGNEGKSFRIADSIRNGGKKPLLVINLDTVPSVIDAHADCVDGFVMMGIHPGVLKQVHRPDAVVDKLKCVNRNVFGKFIQCDGGVSFASARKLVKHGINNLVCGTSTIFKNAPDSHSRAEFLRSRVKELKDGIISDV